MKIRVNSIAPGAIKTPINRMARETPEAEQQLLKLIPYKRVGDVSDIGKAFQKKNYACNPIIKMENPGSNGALTLSERQWGTVREDYSEHGTAWDYFPHDHARSRVYRWGEDGLAGISDDKQRLCFAITLWNGNDQFLTVRL